MKQALSLCSTHPPTQCQGRITSIHFYKEPENTGLILAANLVMKVRTWIQEVLEMSLTFYLSLPRQEMVKHYLTPVP